MVGDGGVPLQRRLFQFAINGMELWAIVCVCVCVVMSWQGFKNEVHAGNYLRFLVTIGMICGTMVYGLIDHTF